MRSHVISEVVVRVRCERCQRGLGWLYGTATDPIAFATVRMSGLLPAGARVDYFRCHRRCGAEPTARWDKLVPAYRAAGPDGTVWLPIRGT